LALLVLLAILVVSSFMLMPGQSLRVLGTEVLATGIGFWALSTRIELQALRNVKLQNWAGFIGNFILLEVGVVPYIVGGLLILFGDAKGFYWVAAAVITSIVKAVLDAWVVLVEINR
jgi:modulator of FtsH protease